MREGCSDDELDEEERAIVGEQKGRCDLVEIHGPGRMHPFMGVRKGNFEHGTCSRVRACQNIPFLHSWAHTHTCTHFSARDLYPCRRVSYDASRVYMAQSLYESAVSGAPISQEDRVMMARSDLDRAVPDICTAHVAVGRDVMARGHHHGDIQGSPMDASR